MVLNVLLVKLVVMVDLRTVVVQAIGLVLLVTITTLLIAMSVDVVAIQKAKS